MNYHEKNRLAVVKQLEEKTISQKAAASKLNLCSRQMRRVQLRYHLYGVKGILSKRLGKPSNNRFSHHFKSEIADLIKRKYAGLSPTVTHKKMTEQENKNLSIESTRKIMIEFGLWIVNAEKNQDSHRTRINFKRLIQVDASLQEWF